MSTVPVRITTTVEREHFVCNQDVAEEVEIIIEGTVDMTGEPGSPSVTRGSAQFDPEDVAVACGDEGWYRNSYLQRVQCKPCRGTGEDASAAKIELTDEEEKCIKQLLEDNAMVPQED